MVLSPSPPPVSSAAPGSKPAPSSDTATRSRPSSLAEPDVDMTGVPMSHRIGQRLADDSQDRLLLLRRHLDLGLQRKLDLEAPALGELSPAARCTRQRQPGRSGQTSDHAAGFVNRPLGDGRDLSQPLVVGGPREVLALARDERHVLDQAVVQVPGHPPPLVCGGELAQPALVAADLADAGDQQRRRDPEQGPADQRARGRYRWWKPVWEGLVRPVGAAVLESASALLMPTDALVVTALALSVARTRSVWLPVATLLQV